MNTQIPQNVKAARMMVYGVNADEKLREELEKVEPDKVLSSLSEISI